MDTSQADCCLFQFLSNDLGELPVILSMTSVSQTALSDKLLDLAQKVPWFKCWESSSHPVLKGEDTAHQAALVMYFVVDHVGWWKQVHRGVKSGSKTIQMGLKWLAVSSFISLYLGSMQSEKPILP